MDVIRFLKDWTLPVSMGIGAVTYLVFNYVPQLDDAATFFAPIMEAILPLFMFLVYLQFALRGYRDGSYFGYGTARR